MTKKRNTSTLNIDLEKDAEAQAKSIAEYLKRIGGELKSYKIVGQELCIEFVPPVPLDAITIGTTK